MSAVLPSPAQTAATAPLPVHTPPPLSDIPHTRRFTFHTAPSRRRRGEHGGCGQGPRSFTARLDHSRFQWWRPARRTYTELSLVDHSGGSPHQWGAWLAAHKQNLGRKPRRSTPLPPASLLLPAGETTWLRPPPYSHRQRNRGDTPPSGARSYHRRPRCRRCRRRRCSRRHNRSGTPLLGIAGVVPPPHRLGRGTRRAGARTACGPCGTRRRAAVPEQARDP